MVATHPQWDHVGGLPWVLQTFEVGEYWSNGVSRSKAFYKRLQTAVQEAELEEHIIGAGSDIIASGPCSLSVLSPFAKKIPLKLVSTHDISGTELNNRSLVTRLDCGPHSFVFTADAEQQALEHLQTHAARPLGEGGQDPSPWSEEFSAPGMGESDRCSSDGGLGRSS